LVLEGCKFSLRFQLEDTFINHCIVCLYTEVESIT